MKAGATVLFMSRPLPQQFPVFHPSDPRGHLYIEGPAAWHVEILQQGKRGDIATGEKTDKFGS